MQVRINGRSIYSPLYGGAQWSELPITVDDIDRIEITRGPNAASAGVGKDYTRSRPKNTFSAHITHQFDNNWDASMLIIKRVL